LTLRKEKADGEECDRQEIDGSSTNYGYDDLKSCVSARLLCVHDHWGNLSYSPEAGPGAHQRKKNADPTDDPAGAKWSVG